MKLYTVEAYVDDSGRCRFDEWIRALKDHRAIVAIHRRIARLEVGNFGDVKNLGQNLYEFRIDFGPGYRVYFTKENNQLVVLLVGGNKSSQQKDILKAKLLIRSRKERDYETKENKEY